MNRFLVFAGDFYYPSGGAGDLVGAAETLPEALAIAKEKGEGEYRWWNILNAETLEVIDTDPPQEAPDAGS